MLRSALGRAIGVARAQLVQSAFTAHATTAIAAAGAAAFVGAAATATICEQTDVTPTESITLRDGRRLAFRCFGDPNGVAVFALHGMGSCHLTWVTAQPLATIVHGVRLIALDRPGYGDSSNPPAGYSYKQAADDIEQLADALGVQHFAVAGHSSGGPYALAVAALLPSRVTACAAICSDPPYAHARTPDAVRASDTMATDFYGKDPVAKVGKWAAKAMEAGPASKRHAWKQGPVGFVTDFMLERLPWAFQIESIELGERLTFWVGEKDYPSIVLGAPWMQALVPGSRLRVVKDGTHGFKSDPDHLRAILEELRDRSVIGDPNHPHWHAAR